MNHTVETIWTGGMSFESNVNGFKIQLDAGNEFGGQNKGPRPKPLMLTALAGCTGMDVISILQKMKIQIKTFKIIIDAVVHEEHPQKYDSMHLIYQFTGNNLEEEKLKKAINLSIEKYCGVIAVYKQSVNITYSIKIN